MRGVSGGAAPGARGVPEANAGQVPRAFKRIPFTVESRPEPWCQKLDAPRHSGVLTRTEREKGRIAERLVRGQCTGSGLVEEHLRFHPRVRGLAAGLVEQHHQPTRRESSRSGFLTVRAPCPVEHQLALLRPRMPCCSGNSGSRGIRRRACRARAEIDAGGTVRAGVGHGRALFGEGAEPVEGPMDFRGC